MSDKQYPPLPEKRYFGYSTHTCDDIMGYTAEDMHAYVDADRAQLLPLTDEQCDAIAHTINSWSLGVDPWEYRPSGRQAHMNVQRSLIRAALNTPPRPDAGND